MAVEASGSKADAEVEEAVVVVVVAVEARVVDSPTRRPSTMR